MTQQELKQTINELKSKLKTENDEKKKLFIQYQIQNYEYRLNRLIENDREKE